jgi:hypothetical protein
VILKHTTYTGEFPRTNAYLIADHAAQQAVDCDFLDGSLRGTKTDDRILTIAGTNIKSLFVYERSAAQNTYYWQRDVDAVLSPVVNDAYARFYWSDGSGFYVSAGNVGGNGEPSESNRYMVGVPRPASALVRVDADMVLQGVTGYSFELCDERTDGTFSNCTPITGSLTFGPTSGTMTFTARSPQTVNTGGGTTTGETPPATTGTWYLINSAAKAYGVPLPSYATSPIIIWNASVVSYYKDPAGIQPLYLQVTVPSAGDGGDQETQLKRIGDTYWYNTSGTGSTPTTEGPSNQTTTSTTVNSPFIGPALKISMTRAEGGPLQAIIRPNSDDTTWPVELPGYTGSLTVTGTGATSSYTLSISAKQDYIEVRAYTYTYVNQYGEEGAPADPLEIECAENSTIVVRHAAPPTGYCPISKVRIYRTAGSGADYLYVGEYSVASPYQITDSVKNESLGHTLDTMNYYPPSQTLVGLCTMANGIVCGFTGNEVHFSEPYLAYAYNPSAIKPMPHKIKGICPFEGGLYVTTTAEPYIIQGAAPEYMTDMKVAAVQAGVSKGSICNYNGTVVYASSDGLVQLQGTQASLDMSFKFFTRQDWQERYGNKLNNMRLNVHDGSLLVWFDDGTKGFVIRFEEESPSLTQINQRYYAAFRYPLADALYVSDGTYVYAFRSGGGRNNFTWHSKDFVLPKPTNFGVMQFIGTGTMALTVYADGVEKLSRSVTLNDIGSTIVRLPAGFMARRWSYKMVGSAEIYESYLSNSVGELQGV